MKITSIDLEAAAILRSPWLWDEKTLEWAEEQMAQQVAREAAELAAPKDEG